LPSEFSGTYGRGRAASEVSDRAWLQAMLDSEAALAAACAPADAAQAIAAACRAERFDLTAISAAAAEHATPVIPLVRALREAVGGDFARWVHCGATSQDIIDTAAMRVASRALGAIVDDARGAADACARLAERYRDTPMCGRTLLQDALPISFGLRAAQWLVGLDEARSRLQVVADSELAVQMGGPVGSRSPEVAARVAEQLGLAVPTLPWHTIRVRVACLAAALGILCGVLAKIARDVTLLSANELGEVREGGEGGGSSAMAHKRNPVAAVSVLACAKRMPGLVATMLASMEQEHERAAGAWQAEWGTLSELIALSGSAAAWGREMLDRLEVDPARMRENLERLAAAGVSEAAEPERHLGAANELIDRALASHRA
jgi:3-carboxy-cis,cis-muconate cycloisomerase